MRNVAYVIFAFVFVAATAYPQDFNYPEMDLNGTIPAKIHAAHAVLFNKNQQSNRLQSLIAEGQPGIRVGTGQSVIPLSTTPEKELKKAICSADSIAVLLIGSSECSFSSHKDWIFTDYLAEVRRVIKSNPKRPMRPESNIVVGRSGGQVETSSGRQFAVVDGPQLSKSKEYLIFLRYVPESGQYTTLDPMRIFDVHGERFKLSEGSNSDPFVGEIGNSYDLDGLTNFVKETTCQ